jgi:hypothetical protein
VYDALFSVAYRVVFTYLVMCFGDKVLGHRGSLGPVRIVAYGESCSWMDILQSCFQSFLFILYFVISHKGIHNFPNMY